MTRPTFSVLLVEDVPTIAKIVERSLKNSRMCTYRVEVRDTLARAVDCLQHTDCDAVLLDLNLPDSAGLDTLARIMETAPEVPVVVLTATNDDEVARKAVQSGAQDYLIKKEVTNTGLDRSILYSIERHRLQRTLRQLAVVDELTGLYNRRGFRTLSDDLLERVHGGTASGYFCCFDLDGFKPINDTFGHARGDEALAEFAGLLRNAFRKDGLLVRMGGDEFAALGVETHPGAAAESVRALYEHLEARNTAGLVPFRLDTSCGLVVFGPGDRRTIDELAAAADTVLYENKRSRAQARKQAAAAAAVDRTAAGLAPESEALVRRLRDACHAHDPALADHHARVADHAARVAERLGLPADRVAAIRLAASLHDVGKTEVPAELLHRKGTLNAEEMERVREHVVAGFRMLDSSPDPLLQCAASVALSHHEQWSGQGYPHGLAGEEIPLEARIVKVVDVFDAMLYERSYKAAWDLDRVIAELRKDRGEAFDPQVLDAFLEVLAATQQAEAANR